MMKIKNVLQILLGTAIFAFGLNYLVIPNSLYEGGLTGITLIAYYLFQLPPSVSNILINIPLFLIGWRLLGKKMLYYSLIGTVAVSVWLEIFSKIPLNIALKNDLLLTSLLIGGTLGIGLGLVFNAGGTTGGSDILARIFNKYLGISIGRIMLLIDFMVLLLTFIVFHDLRLVLYTLIFVAIASRVIDIIGEGGHTGKAFMVVTTQAQVIADSIGQELDRGVTFFKGQGNYSKTNFNIVYCIVSRNEIRAMKEIIHRHDPSAFISITETTEVMGEGFTLDENKQPLEKY